jgi:hypothetical protein
MRSKREYGIYLIAGKEHQSCLDKVIGDYDDVANAELKQIEFKAQTMRIVGGALFRLAVVIVIINVVVNVVVNVFVVVW